MIVTATDCRSRLCRQLTQAHLCCFEYYTLCQSINQSVDQSTLCTLHYVSQPTNQLISRTCVLYTMSTSQSVSQSINQSIDLVYFTLSINQPTNQSVNRPCVLYTVYQPTNQPVDLVHFTLSINKPTNHSTLCTLHC